jgi:hypothetical protein
MRVDVVNEGNATASTATVSASESGGIVTFGSPASVVLAPMTEGTGIVSSAEFDVRASTSATCLAATSFTFTATAPGQTTPSTTVAATKVEAQPAPQAGLTWTADFETTTGNNAWTATPSGLPDWTRINACNHTPGGSWVSHFPTTANCSTTLSCGDNRDEQLTSPVINLGASDPSPVDVYTLKTLSFWVLGSAETGWDFDRVEISPSGSAAGPWVEVFSHSATQDLPVPLRTGPLRRGGDFEGHPDPLPLHVGRQHRLGVHGVGGRGRRPHLGPERRDLRLRDLRYLHSAVPGGDRRRRSRAREDRSGRDVLVHRARGSLAERVYWFSTPDPQPGDFGTNDLAVTGSGTRTALHRNELDPTAADFGTTYYYVVAASCDGNTFVH